MGFNLAFKGLKNICIYATFEVITAVLVKIQFFWVMTPCFLDSS